MPHPNGPLAGLELITAYRAVFSQSYGVLKADYRGGITEAIANDVRGPTRPAICRERRADVLWRKRVGSLDTDGRPRRQDLNFY